jgi:hypothetical protein
MKTPLLAHIAFALDCNNSDEEDAILLPLVAPYGYQSPPVPVKKETRQVRRYGKGEQPCFTEMIETFSDGSQRIYAL